MTIYTYLLIGTIVVLILWAIGSYLVVRNLEEPQYTVLEKRDGYEIRQYKPYIIAETTITSTGSRTGLTQGFSLVADYIFGNNTTKEKISMTTPVLEQSEKSNEKIAMTIPVLEESTDDNRRTVSFVLPSKYTLDTLPTPNNDRVTLREVPGYKAAVVRFTWYSTPQRVAHKTAALRTALEKDGVSIIGEPQAAFYNPPLSMPLILRNEIIIPVE